MPTTEVAIVQLVPGSEIGNPENATAKALQDSTNVIRQQDGCQEVLLGAGVESSQTATMLINWDSIDKHKEFIASNAFGPFSKNFESILDGPPRIHHVDFQPPGGLTSATSAPVTEMATFYFNGSPDANMLESVKGALEAMEKDTGMSLKRWAWGVTHEELEYEGVKGKAAVLALGWDSVEDHMTLRGMESFKKNIGGLRGESQKIEMHHVGFQLG